MASPQMMCIRAKADIVEKPKSRQNPVPKVAKLPRPDPGRSHRSKRVGLMDTQTLLIIIVLVLLLGGGGWYGRGRWF